MQTDLPFFEGPEDALRSVVQHLGGAKKVGLMLWPDLSADNAGRKLLDCLNVSRAEKLEIGQVMFLFSRAKDAGLHSPFQWFSGEIGYDARAITKAEEEDRLTTVVEQTTKTLADALGRLERMQRARAAA